MRLPLRNIPPRHVRRAIIEPTWTSLIIPTLIVAVSAFGVSRATNAQWRIRTLGHHVDQAVEIGLEAEADHLDRDLWTMSDVALTCSPG